MAAFAFKAVNARGKNTNGVLEGDNARCSPTAARKRVNSLRSRAGRRALTKKAGLSFSLFKPRISHQI